MWDVLLAAVDALRFVNRWRFYVGTAVGCAFGAVLAQVLGESGLFLQIAFGLVGGLVGAIWQWRSQRDQ